jgi:hypothetical protein
VTFTEEKEQVSWRKKGEILLDGDRLKILEAEDPSDIIWENRLVKDSTRYWGAFKFTLVMLLFFTFIMAKQLKGAVS